MLGSHEETTCVGHKTSEVISTVPNDEEEAKVNLDIDTKQLNKDCEDVLSNVVGEGDYHEKCPSIGNETNDHFRYRGVNAPSSYHNVVVSCNNDEDVSPTRSCLTNDSSEIERKDGDQTCQYNMDPACYSEYTTLEHVPEETKPEDEVLPSVDNSVETKEASIERPSSKLQNTILLKSVLGGTAAFGVLFMFLQLRKNAREKPPASSKASSISAKDKVQKISSKGIRKNRREGVYPAEKLKMLQLLRHCSSYSNNFSEICEEFDKSTTKNVSSFANSSLFVICQEFLPNFARRKMSENDAHAKEAAEAAIKCIGLGYDLTYDIKLKYCKRYSADPRLIDVDDDHVRNIELPGGISIPNVPNSIKCDKGERLRLCSDVLSFQQYGIFCLQMSEKFNQELSLSGKIPSGPFNVAFDFLGAWHTDAASTKSLAFNGVSITLYSLAFEDTQVVLRDHVKQAVPSSWDPVALARFIDMYGTHIIVGVKMGGSHIIYAKQPYSSPEQPADVQKKLKDFADTIFIDRAGHDSTTAGKLIEKEKFAKYCGLSFKDFQSHFYYDMEDIYFTCKKRGGSGLKNLSHNEWCLTVQSLPVAISMSFIPITSLLSGIKRSGFLIRAINLYLQYKPPLEELSQFLEFQLQRQWAPVSGELFLGPERKPLNALLLNFNLMGPKLYVNTTPVDVGKKPVTGLRLYLEGKRSNCLAFHLQHLSSLPKSFQIQDELNGNVSDAFPDPRYYEKVPLKNFSHVCTAPVESEDDLSIVTGAHFEVRKAGPKKVLFLRLHFSKVAGAALIKDPEWDGSPGLTQKSGIISTLISTRFSAGKKLPPLPSDVYNSEEPPAFTHKPKLLRFVDTRELTRGPHDSPGYWVVSGARLYVDEGKISLKAKYSLISSMPDEEVIVDVAVFVYPTMDIVTGGSHRQPRESPTQASSQNPDSGELRKLFCILIIHGESTF
ncbi:MACPF domain-containing protein [Senna tora]|uniref:MACPF domain-containing protein n=1 Tax=Senna tora TaxID=362788 RepID=A0A834WXG6_9FABA|nr:MACPF domain-containing protein [Senna tora]